MSEHQNPTSTPPVNIADVMTKIEALLTSNGIVVIRVKEMMSTQVKLSGELGEIRERVSILAPMLGQINTGQNEVRGQLLSLISVIQKSIESLKEDLLKEFGEQQAKLRGMLLARMDGLRDEMSQLRETVRNSWNTADYAIRAGSNLRNDTNGIREEMDKLLTMISTMQKQQHLLESQVEVLRRNAAEKDGNA